MNGSRLAGLLMLFGIAIGCAPANALDAYPSKPIRVIVPFAAGGLLDAHVRLIAPKVSEKLGQPVIIENRAGADGLLAIRLVKSLPADGYTFMATGETISIQPALRVDPGYDLEKDFTGVGQISQAPFVLVTGVGQPEKTFAEVVARAKAEPGQLSYASAGTNTSTHFAAAVLMHQAGLRMLHVPYKGNAAAMPDVMGGRINLIFAGAQQLRAGKLRPLGVSSLVPLPAFPEVPTFKALGVPNFSYSSWYGIVAPTGTPKDAIQRFSEAMRAAVASEIVQRHMRAEGSEAVYRDPTQFSSLMLTTMRDVDKLAADLGLKKE